MPGAQQELREVVTKLYAVLNGELTGGLVLVKRGYRASDLPILSARLVQNTLTDPRRTRVMVLSNKQRDSDLFKAVFLTETKRQTRLLSNAPGPDGAPWQALPELSKWAVWEIMSVSPSLHTHCRYQLPSLVTSLG